MSDPMPPPDGRAFEPPIDQQPVDQQPLPPRPPSASPPDASPVPSTPSMPSLPSIPMLPGSLGASLDGPAMAAQPVEQPIIPPLETTSPVDFVDAAPSVTPTPAPAPTPTPTPTSTPASTTPSYLPSAGATNRSTPSSESSDFEPLRVDPPPTLVPTWWLRSALLVAFLAAPALVLWVEYTGEADDVLSSFPVLVVHLAATAMLLVWSFLAMGNAARLVPPTRYQRRSSGPVAVMLWCLAGAAPVAVITGWNALSDRRDDADDLTATGALVGLVLVAFVLLWLPFRYHARQASRIGAPHRVMWEWFFAPLFAAVGGISAVALGLGEMLAEDGLTATERTAQVAVAYALPMVVFALTTWRAVTVFDEVIDLRWRRWRVEWEQTLGRMAAEPLPGPEDSPDIGGLSGP